MSQTFHPGEGANPEIDIESFVTQDGVALYRLLLRDPNAAVVTPEERRLAESRLRILLAKCPGRVALCQEMIAQEAYKELHSLLRRFEAN